MSELPKLPDLPPLDELDSKPAKDDTPSLSLPELPDLNDLDYDTDDSSRYNESTPDYEDEEGFVIEDTDGDIDEGIEPVAEIHEEEEDDEDDWEDDWDEEQLDEEQFMSFLPPVSVDEVEISDEEIEEIEEQIDEEIIAPQPKEKDSNELDEEAIKEFFINLKNKIFKKSKGSSNKSTKISKKPNAGKLIKPVIAIAAIGIIILASLNFLGAGFRPINELSIESTSDDTVIKLSEFTIDDSLHATITNESDSSIELFIDVTFTEKGTLPFANKKVTCSSDFIGMEVDEEQEITLDCQLNENAKYKASIDITNTY